MFGRSTTEAKERREADRARALSVLLTPTRSIHRGTYSGGTSGAAIEKGPDGRIQKIRDSAKGEECLVRIPGVCRFDPDYTIWSHAPFMSGGKGRSLKAFDLCGAYACTACDAAIDRQATLPSGMTREQVELDWFHGHLRSLVRLAEKGLL